MYDFIYTHIDVQIQWVVKTNEKCVFKTYICTYVVYTIMRVSNIKNKLILRVLPHSNHRLLTTATSFFHCYFHQPNTSVWHTKFVYLLAFAYKCVQETEMINRHLRPEPFIARKEKKIRRLQNERVRKNYFLLVALARIFIVGRWAVACWLGGVKTFVVYQLQ